MLELKSQYKELVSLKSAFHRAIMEGSAFDEVKKIYIQIKEIERSIYARKIQKAREKSSMN